MRLKKIVTLAASIVAGIGAASLSATPAEAVRSSGFACAQGGSCGLGTQMCAYGQKDQWGNCNISWPPPCETCADDCCVTVNET
jgi:hypothetical protein